MEKINFYLNKKIIYIDVIRNNNKNMYLKVNGDKIIISANKRVQEKDIRTFVEQHIEKFVDYINNKKKNVLYSIEEGFIYMNGLKKSFSVLTGFNKNNLIINKNKVYINTKSGNDVEVDEAIKLWMKVNLENHINKVHRKIEEYMNSIFHNVRTTYKTSTWGTNNIRKNSISYSTKLSHFDDDVKTYVYIHEISHYFEPNHSTNFWNIVQKYCPKYKILRKKLKSDVNMHTDE